MSESKPEVLFMESKCRCGTELKVQYTAGEIHTVMVEFDAWRRDHAACVSLVEP